MIAREGRDRFNFVGGKSGQIAMLDEVIGMLMVLADINHIADVMQDGGIFQPFAFSRIQSMQRFRLIEETRRQCGDMLNMRLR